ncbi:MAG TPA: endo-1,4-beta-xylanase [Candidatus Sulfotelmatobacter sp.]|nr:endo-1,4-beta-xylanase [Candidatus Sulfotelmatobacter sp.]
MPRFIPIFFLALLLPSRAAAPVALRQTAERAGILIGTAVRPGLLTEAAYSATLAREFNMIEPEDAMKWWVIRQSPNYFDFRGGDEIAAFAHAHGMKLRGHCLVWDHNNPDWLAQRKLNPAQASELLQQHIKRVMEHYAGQVFAWDVVNEALDERGQFKDSPWYNQPGIGFANRGAAYVEQAFQWAHEADPKALLFYNDNGAEGMTRKSDAVYEMVKEFKHRGVPIDGVGLQMHLSRLDYDVSGVVQNIARLTALGLQVHITELDVSLPLQRDGTPTKEDVVGQANLYRSVMHVCLQNPGCTAVQTWGFTDKYSWIGSHTHGMRGAALPFDGSYQTKPAYDAMIQEMSRQTATR